MRNFEGKEAKRQPLPVTNDSTDDQATSNITIIQVSSPLHSRKTKDKSTTQLELPDEDENYRSNVQIIPSNFTPTIPAVATNPVEAKVTTVQVSSYGKIVNPIVLSNICRNVAASKEAVPTDAPSNTIRSFSSITNIPINADNPTSSNTTQLHYEQVFANSPTSTPKATDGQNVPLSSKFNFAKQKSTSQNEVHINRINLSKSDSEDVTTVSNGSGSSTSFTVLVANTSETLRTVLPSSARNVVKHSSTNQIRENTIASQSPFIRPLLTRGATEAVIQRPSRKDTNLISRGRNKPQLVNTLKNELFEL